MNENAWRVLPKEFLERLARIVSPEKLETVLRAFTTKRPTTFRVNTLKTTREALLVKLSACGIEVEAVPWYKDAFILRNKSKQELIETPLYQHSEIYIQSLSSMMPTLVLDPQPGEKVCDLAAAPGSKTTQIAAMMGSQGEIVANDRSQTRLYKLAANLRAWGATNVRITHLAGERFWREYPQYFDKTLVDAPCSLEGRFDVGDPKTYAGWSVWKVQSLGKRQRWLLRSAVSATRPGGVIVYATCTLSPEENEAVIDWILDKERGVVEVEPIDVPLENLQAGSTRWGRKGFSPHVQLTVRILPSDLMEGFYIAKLRKRCSNV